MIEFDMNAMLMSPAELAEAALNERAGRHAASANAAASSPAGSTWTIREYAIEMQFWTRKNAASGRRNNSARSDLAGVQELLPRRRRQRFALVVLARNGLSSASAGTCAMRVPGVRAFDSPFRASRTAKAPASVCPRPISSFITSVQFCFMNHSG